jgi:diguanylate cyclase (GGDEF)-like protein
MSCTSVGDLPAGVLVAPAEFGPFHELATRAHRYYVDGFSEQATQACRRWLQLTTAAGDVVTSRYLRYVEAIALQELGRDLEVLEAAKALLADLGDELEPVWRAKALSVVAESSGRVGLPGQAIAALAEADWLIQAIPAGSYGHLSASVAVALALRSLSLVEQADAALSRIGAARDSDANIFVAQELALLSSYWGAALVLIGRDHDAAGHFARSASRARAMILLAAATGNEQMAARGEVIEAYAIMHLGELALAAARAKSAAGRFTPRPELVETHLLHLVLAQEATSAGRFCDAREHLATLISDAEVAAREVWAATGRAALAGVHEAHFGPHPGLDEWRTVARNALSREWSEREARFAALRGHDHLRELTAETHRVGKAAMQDPLTGLGNRRALADFLSGTAGLGWVVFVDVDDFKGINDTYSHAVGDDVLCAVADMLRSASRETDLLVRYGGDEFLIVPGGEEAVAVSLAERVHRAVLHGEWSRIADGLSVTVSIGVGHAADASSEPLAAADGALMRAKRTGRNRVVVAS